MNFRNHHKSPRVCFILIVNEKEKKSEEPDRLSARSISVLRPRAVLSSPDNDEMIGGKNRKRVIQPSPLRNHNTVQNRHAQCKIIPIQTTTESPVSTRRKPAGAVTDQTPYTTGNLNSTKGKPKAAKDQTPSKLKQSGIIASSQRANLKTVKPKTTGSQHEKPNSTGSQLGRMSQN
uniref:Uncharacterized protein n=1 Tax=Kalanchoe fedtschenkoi TaxID=63787 RepID=A0A7N0V4V3_KALFE